MQSVNKKMDPQKTLQTMQNFQKENMKMEMTEEMSKLCVLVNNFNKHWHYQSIKTGRHTLIPLLNITNNTWDYYQ